MDEELKEASVTKFHRFSAEKLRSLLVQCNRLERKLTAAGFNVCFNHNGGKSLSVSVRKHITL